MRRWRESTKGGARECDSSSSMKKDRSLSKTALKADSLENGGMHFGSVWAGKNGSF